MKSLLMVVLFGLAAIGCSKKENPPLINTDLSFTTLEAKSANPGNLNFGDVAHDKVVLISVTILNTGTEVLSGTPTITSSIPGAFSIPYIQTTNCANLAINKTCLIKISLNAKLLSSGLKTETLSYSSLTFPVVANILPAPGNLEKTVSMPMEVDFGSLTPSQSILKTITIQNTSTIALLETITVSPPFVLAYNGCSASLLPGKSCTVKVSLSGSIGAGTYQSHVLSYGTVGSSALKGIIQSPAMLSNIVAVYNSQNLTPGSITDLGTLQQGSSQTLTVMLKNIGSGAAAVSSLNLGSSQMSFTYNNCQGLTLQPNSSCTLKISLNPSGSTPESLTVGLAHGDIRLFSFSYIFQEMRKLSVTASSKVSISSSPAGLTCSSGTCSKNFIKNSAITLDTSVATGFTISSWPAPASCSLIGTSMLCELTSDISLPIPVLSCASGYIPSGSNCVIAPAGGPLAFSNLNSSSVVNASQLVLDSDDGRKKFTLNGTCSENGEEIRVVLDEFEGEYFEGTPKSSMFCDNFVNYNCSAPAELFTTCTNNQFSIKIPLQNLADFWWWWPYAGDTEINAYYVSNPSLSPVKFTFKNYATRSQSYQPSDIVYSWWFNPINPVSSDYANLTFEFDSPTVSLILQGWGSRFNNPRNFSYITTQMWGSYWDYPEATVDSNGYPVVGEAKFSLNNTCSGGTWVRGVSGVDSPAIVNSITLPIDGSILEVSYQFRDTILNEFSPCQVMKLKKFQTINPSLATSEALNESASSVITGDVTTSWERFYINTSVNEGNISYYFNLYNGLTNCENGVSYSDGFGSGMNSFNLPSGSIDFTPYIRMFSNSGTPLNSCQSLNVTIHNTNPVLGYGWTAFGDIGNRFIQVSNSTQVNLYLKSSPDTIGTQENSVGFPSLNIHSGAASGNGYMALIDNNQRQIYFIWRSDGGSSTYRASIQLPYEFAGCSQLEIDRSTNKALAFCGSHYLSFSINFDPVFGTSSNMISDVRTIPNPFSFSYASLLGTNKVLVTGTGGFAIYEDNGTSWVLSQIVSTGDNSLLIGLPINMPLSSVGTKDGFIAFLYQLSNNQTLGLYFFEQDAQGNYSYNPVSIISGLNRFYSVAPSGLKMIIRTEVAPYQIKVFKRASLDESWDSGTVIKEFTNSEYPNFYWMEGENKVIYFGRDTRTSYSFSIP